MKWNSKSDWGKTTWTGRKNGIKFEIKENFIAFTRDVDGYYVIANIVKNEMGSLNSLWVMPKFKTLEETQEWCEKLTQDELIKLRELGLSKNK